MSNIISDKLKMIKNCPTDLDYVATMEIVLYYNLILKGLIKMEVLHLTGR